MLPCRSLDFSLAQAPRLSRVSRVASLAWCLGLIFCSPARPSLGVWGAHCLGFGGCTVHISPGFRFSFRNPFVSCALQASEPGALPNVRCPLFIREVRTQLKVLALFSAAARATSELLTCASETRRQVAVVSCSSQSSSAIRNFRGSGVVRVYFC